MRPIWRIVRFAAAGKVPHERTGAAQGTEACRRERAGSPHQLKGPVTPGVGRCPGQAGPCRYRRYHTVRRRRAVQGPQPLRDVIQFRPWAPRRGHVVAQRCRSRSSRASRSGAPARGDDGTSAVTFSSDTLRPATSGFDTTMRSKARSGGRLRGCGPGCQPHQGAVSSIGGVIPARLVAGQQVLAGRDDARAAYRHWS